jgi:hypothetical protein
VESKLKESTVIKIPHYLPEEDPILEQPIWTARNQKIIKVYYRKNRAPRSLAPHNSLFFDASSFMKETEATRTPLKRNATPVVDQELEGVREPCLLTKVTNNLLCLISRVRKKGRTSQDAPRLGRVRIFLLTSPLNSLIWLPFTR